MRWLTADGVTFIARAAASKLPWVTTAWNVANWTGSSGISDSNGPEESLAGVQEAAVLAWPSWVPCSPVSASPSR